MSVACVHHIFSQVKLVPYGAFYIVKFIHPHVQKKLQINNRGDFDAILFFILKCITYMTQVGHVWKTLNFIGFKHNLTTADFGFIYLRVPFNQNIKNQNIWRGLKILYQCDILAPFSKARPICTYLNVTKIKICLYM